MFEPSLVHGSVTTLSPFRYWCQKVLPLVYDNSLSYYELLCKVVEYLNETMENVNTIGENTNALYNSYLELVEYVNNYFANLDVQEEINNKLDVMVENGELTALIAPYLTVVTPEMYGAVGDGVSDDTGAFNAMIADLKCYTKIYLKGTYLISSTITFNTFGFMYGCGKIVVALELNPCIMFKKGAELNGITFNGNNTTSTLIKIEESCKINNCLFENLADSINVNKQCLFISDCDFVDIRNTYFKNIAPNSRNHPHTRCISLNTGCNNQVIENCFFYDVQAAIVTAEFNDVAIDDKNKILTINGCTFVRCSGNTIYYVEYGEKLSVTNCYFEECSQPIATSGRTAFIENNVFKNCIERCVRISPKYENIKMVNIANNYFEGEDPFITDLDVGERLDTVTENLTITNNVFNNTANGFDANGGLIYLLYQSYVKIEDNIFNMTMSQYGSFIRNKNNTGKFRIIGNTFNDNSDGTTNINLIKGSTEELIIDKNMCNKNYAYTNNVNIYGGNKFYKQGYGLVTTPCDVYFSNKAPISGNWHSGDLIINTDYVENPTVFAWVCTEEGTSNFSAINIG